MLSKFKTIFFPKHLENGFSIDRNKEFFFNKTNKETKAQIRN